MRLVTEDRGHLSPCRIWTGSLAHSGYGQVRDGKKMAKAHVVVWEHHHGQKPQGMELDHLCRVPACCNPEHLELVTHHENMMRSNTPSAQNARKTHCIHGHVFSPENTKVRSQGWRECIPCYETRKRLRREKRAGF